MVFYIHFFRITNERMVLVANGTCVLSLELNYDIVFLLWRIWCNA